MKTPEKINNFILRKESDIINMRLKSQKLVFSNFKTAKQVVEWFGAIQSQEYFQAKWAIGLRMPFSMEKTIEDELRIGNILRTHILRPTWHFVSRDDIRWMLSISAPRVQKANKHYYKKLSLTTALFRKCEQILKEILKNKNYLTRLEIKEHFAKKGINATGHKLAHIMMWAELGGIVTSGPRNGEKFTYALLDEVVPVSEKIKTRKQCLGEIAKRYFQSRGPSTLKDFSVWSGLTIKECNEGLQEIKNQLSSFKLENKEFYFKKDLKKSSSNNLFLFPAFDEFLIGYKDTRNIIFQDKKSPDANSLFNIIFCDEKVIGGWRISLKSKQLSLECKPLKAFSKKQAYMLKKETNRLKHFFENQSK